MNAVPGPVSAARFDEDALRRGVASVRHPLTRALLMLTFTTGLVDAVSYLALGRVFTANMTGNIVLLGFGIARSAAADRACKLAFRTGIDDGLIGVDLTFKRLEGLQCGS